MQSAPIPSVGGHDIVDTHLLELIKNLGFDIIEPRPPAILPDPIALLR